MTNEIVSLVMLGVTLYALGDLGYSVYKDMIKEELKEMDCRAHGIPYNSDSNVKIRGPGTLLVAGMLRLVDYQVERRIHKSSI